MNIKIGLYVVIAILVALLAGFLWGRAGLTAARSSLSDAELQRDLATARADLLAARVDLFEVNFGRASQHLQAAKASLAGAATRIDDRRAAQIKDVTARVDRAQDLVARLDQSANTRLGEAVALVEQVSQR